MATPRAHPWLTMTRIRLWRLRRLKRLFRRPQGMALDLMKACVAVAVSGVGGDVFGAVDPLAAEEGLASTPPTSSGDVKRRLILCLGLCIQVRLVG